MPPTKFPHRFPPPCGPVFQLLLLLQGRDGDGELAGPGRGGTAPVSCLFQVAMQKPGHVCERYSTEVARYYVPTAAVRLRGIGTLMP